MVVVKFPNYAHHIVVRSMTAHSKLFKKKKKVCVNARETPDFILFVGLIFCLSIASKINNN